MHFAFSDGLVTQVSYGGSGGGFLFRSAFRVGDPVIPFFYMCWRAALFFSPSFFSSNITIEYDFYLLSYQCNAACT